jgi:acetyl esterase/lipase
MRACVFLLLFGTALFSRAADYQIQANIRYSRYPETVLDIVQPRAPALRNRPGVIVIHGGGWVEGDKEGVLERFCLPFVQRDFVVANIEYRLAKSAPAPAAVEDVLKAARWFQDHALDFKVDPAHIIVAGDSAGGQLALLTAMLPASTSLGPVIKTAAVIDFYGIADVADQVEGPGQRPYAVAWIPPQPNRMQLATQMSAITYVRKGVPPVLAIHGDADPVVPYEQSVLLVKALKTAGDDAELITVPGGQHGFTPEQMLKLWPQIFKWLGKRKIGS